MLHPTPQQVKEKIYSVSEINEIANTLLQQLTVWVEGELTSAEYKPRYRYCYFSLKDPKTEFLLPCFGEPRLISSLPFEFKPGIKLLLLGRLSVYERQGKYQLEVFDIKDNGEGILQRQFEELKNKLQHEGLFTEEHKMQLPKFPEKIGVITSLQGTGAAWLDFKKHSVDRYPFLEITVRDIFVQGINAVPDICQALAEMDRLGLDVLVLTRGGGSLEDLKAFNSEEVARAIFACRTPVVSAIGHEKDFTISDLVADLRCATPTAAANFLVQDYSLFFQRTDHLMQTITTRCNYFLQDKYELLDHLYYKLQQTKNTFKDIPNRLTIAASQLKQVINILKTREHSLERYKILLAKSEQLLIRSKKDQLDNFYADIRRNINLIWQNNLGLVEENYKKIELLSPKSTMARGYSVVTSQRGKVIRSVKDVALREDIKVQLAIGSLVSTVKEKNDDSG